MAIPIGLEVPMLVNLWINFLKSYQFNVPTWLNIASQSYDHILNNRLQGTIFLYRCSALLLLRNQSHHALKRSWMTYRQRCFHKLTTLRHTHTHAQNLLGTTSTVTLHNTCLIQCFVYAFNAAIFANEVPEAKLHVGQFLHELHTARHRGTLSHLDQLLSLTRILHGDAQCALIHARAPVVNPQATELFWRPHFEPFVRLAGEL
jgi:hypothetical protein